MISRKIPGLFVVLSLLFSSCEENGPIIVDSGSADFSNYLAVGNSLTAGYADGGLYREVQLSSYPQIIGTQMHTSLNQPLMPEGNGSGYFYLTSYINGIPGFNYWVEDPEAFSKVSGNFNNLGIPGIRVKDINDKHLANESDYFYRIVPNGRETSTSYIDMIKEASPTFFTCWMGNNDILGYAMDGGDPEGIPLTSISEFEQMYELLIEALTSRDAKGILLTIPDVTAAPFFNLATNEDFPTLNEEWFNELNEIYSEYNNLVTAYNSEIDKNTELSDDEKQKLKRPLIEFPLQGPNAFVIEDRELPGEHLKDKEGNELPKLRHLKSGEKITLYGVLEILNPSSLSGLYQPLRDELVLTLEELKNIENHRDAFNSVIENYALPGKVEIIDTDNLLNEFTNGKKIDGVQVSTQFIEGGLFSLDGIHLTPRGYAIVANEIIDKINQSFSAKVDKVNISNHRGVVIP